MANEGLILESLIHLTKSGKILWWRTGKGYKCDNVARLFSNMCTSEERECPFNLSRANSFMEMPMFCPFRDEGRLYCDEATFVVWTEWLRTRHLY